MKAVFVVISVISLHSFTNGWTFVDNKFVQKTVQDGANKFAVDSFKISLLIETGNFVTAPLGLYMGLATVSYGAQGQTDNELKQVLNLQKPTALSESLTTRSINTISTKIRAIRHLCIASRLFLGRYVSLTPAYQTTVQNTFNGDARNVNFGNRIMASKAMNDWIKDTRCGKINTIVNQDQLDYRANLLVVSAASFLIKWQVPANQSYLASRPFYVSGTQVKFVPMIYQTKLFRTGQLPGMDATFIELLNQNNDNPRNATYMYIIRPNSDTGTIARLSFYMNSLTLEDLQKTEEKRMSVYVPKFTIESTFKMKDHLSEMGIRTAFSEAANFDKIMFERGTPNINEVLHKSFVTLDAEIGEAATPIVDNPEGNMMPAQHLVINKPFLIVIATKDLILLTGRVTDPSATSVSVDSEQESVSYQIATLQI